ncbi:MAG: hypothetical protein ACD_76C00036G0004 [uncultured bacterium]|nr:MAG: hypothetical protein ACD_76C00036G0004 [uncultured bacterium]HBD05366.1 hypothetical protein [Candidatus Uhrbacteria bacterium]
MNTNKQNRQSGFTLVEAIVVIAVLAVVGGLGIAFFLNVLTGSEKAKSQALIQEEARFALRRIEYEIRQAQGFELTADFNVNLAATPASSLDLDMADVLLDPTVFDVSAGVLRISQAGGAAEELTSDNVSVTDLTFKNYSSPNGRSEHVKIILTVERALLSVQTYSGAITLETSVELRN